MPVRDKRRLAGGERKRRKWERVSCGQNEWTEGGEGVRKESEGMDREKDTRRREREESAGCGKEEDGWWAREHEKQTRKKGREPLLTKAADAATAEGK